MHRAYLDTMKSTSAAFLKSDACKHRATEEGTSNEKALNGVGRGFEGDANGNTAQRFYDTRKDGNGNAEHYFSNENENEITEQYYYNEFYNEPEEAGESKNHVLIIDDGQTHDDNMEWHESDLEANIIAEKTKGTGENPEQAQTRAKTLALLSFLITDEIAGGDASMHANSTAAVVTNTTSAPVANNAINSATKLTGNTSELPLFTIIAVFGLWLMGIPFININELTTCFYLWSGVVTLTSIVLLLVSAKKCCVAKMCVNLRNLVALPLLLLLWSLSLAFWWKTFEVPWYAFVVPPTMIVAVLGLLCYRENDRTKFLTGYLASLSIFIGCYIVGVGILSISLFRDDVPLIQEKYEIDNVWRFTSIGNAFIVTIVFFIRIASRAHNDDKTNSRGVTLCDGTSSCTSTCSTNGSDGSNEHNLSRCEGLYVNLIVAPLGFPIIVWIQSDNLNVSLAVSFATVLIVFVGLKIIRSTSSNQNITSSSITTTMKYPRDTYSFLAYYHPIRDPNLFFFGFVVFLFQFVLLILMVLSVAVPNLRTSPIENPGSGWIAGIFPAISNPLVQETQNLSIMAFIFFPDASLTDITNAIELFPKINRADPDYKSRGLAFSCTLRLLQGLMAIFAVFLLVMTSSTVMDIVLNFTAINFISTLDNRAFSLAELGKYGPTVEQAAKTIKNANVPECRSPSANHRRYKYGIFVSSLVLFGAFLFVRGRYENTQV